MNLHFTILGMEDWLFAVLVGGGALIVILIIVMISAAIKRKRRLDIATGKVKIIDGVRYSIDDKLQANNIISHHKGDVILKKGETYKVTKNGYVMPGKYLVLSANENNKATNIRIAGLVREYQHNSVIVLAEGEEVTAVSHSAVLR